MSDNIALYSRLVFVSLPVCVAVVLFIMCSDAARASPITTQVDTGVKHIILRSLFTPFSQRHPLSTGIISAETGLQTGTNSETEMTGKSRKALSIIDHQSNPLWFPGSFGYSHNTPDNRPAQAGVLRGDSTGGLRPASSTFTRHSQAKGQSFQRPQSRSTPYPLIIRKSSQKEANSPFNQSSSFSQVWDHKAVQKFYNKEQAPRNAPPNLATVKTAQPQKAGEYWSTSMPTLRGHYGGYKETNDLSVLRAQSTSGRIQSRKFLGFASQTVSHVPSINNSLDASVIKRKQSPEKLTSSITYSSQGLRSVTSGEALRHKKVQSYLFKDSQTSFDTIDKVTDGVQQASSSFTTVPHKQKPPHARVYGRLASNFQQLYEKDPTKNDDANPSYLNTSVAQYGGQTDSFTTYQRISNMYPPAQHSLYLASGKVRTIDPISHAAPQDNYATSSEKSPVNITTGGSLHVYKSGQSTKNIYGIRGFENLLSPSVKEHSISSSKRTSPQQYSFDKEKDYKFKTANRYPSFSPKYSFGQRRSSTLIPTPAKLERKPADYSPPYSGSLDRVQTTTVSTPRPFTSAFKDIQPLLPDASIDSKQDHRQVTVYKRMYGLKGFGTQPLEGAKTSVREPDMSATFQQGIELKTSPIWQPKGSRIYRWYNQTGETENSDISTQRRNKPSNEDFEPLLQSAGSTKTVWHRRFIPDKYKKDRKIYSFLGFQSVQDRIGNSPKKTHWKHIAQNPTAASPTHRVSTAHFRSAGGHRVESSPASETRTANRSKPIAMTASLFNSSTSSTVRGRLVKGKHIKSRKLKDSAFLINDTVNVAIVRLPTSPARFKAVTYADILGSVSFSSVRATPQTPITLTDEDYFPNTTAMTNQKEGVGYWTLIPDRVYSVGNTSRSPEANAEDAEEKKLGFKIREYDGGIKTFDAFLDNEESGSGIFNLSDVLSTDTTRSQGVSEDLLELDYLRISTENISFKSVKLSHTEE